MPARDESQVAVARTAGQNIYRLRKAAGLRQKDLAEKITAAGFQMLPSTVSKIEVAKHPNGSARALTVDELVVFSTVLGVRPEQLLTPYECERCHGAPPAGFTCNRCGAAKKEV